MRPQDIKVGKSYRHEDHPTYCWAKVIEILKPEQGINNKTYTVVKCEWTQRKDDDFGLIKYFKPSDLVKAKK